jgi:hypothetical protein
MTPVIKVTEAEYIRDFKLKITFSDGTIENVDFQEFLEKNVHPQFNKYRDPRKFEKFQIERGNIVWGKDWDLIFPIEELYAGHIKIGIHNS